MMLGEAGRPLRIMVTNDDGVDSIGLHKLAAEMRNFGEVTVVAPDSEFSGAGASIGPIWEREMRPDVHETTIPGFEHAWAVSGPPALCVLYARMELFGPIPDIVVSGVNPGANIGRSVYHSGTIGAALTARNGSIPGIAVSMPIRGSFVDGREWEDIVAGIPWDTAVTVAGQVVQGWIDNPPAALGVLNLNVPDVAVEQLKGWAWSEVEEGPPRSTGQAALIPNPGHVGSYHVDLEYTDRDREVNPSSDDAAIGADKVALTWLSRITAEQIAAPGIDDALRHLLA